MTELGKTEISPGQVMLLDYPELQPDDVLVFLQENARYIVTGSTGTEMRLVRVHQELAVSELARSSIEYRIPVEPDVNPPRF